MTELHQMDSDCCSSAPTVKILETKVISWQPEYYHGWPTVAKRANGELWVAFSGGRQSHICPFGQLCVMASYDQGDSWTYPRVLLDGPLDERDAGIVETAKGTLIATTFSSTAYIQDLNNTERAAALPTERLNRWKAVHARLNDEGRQRMLSYSLVRSTDGGLNWSARIAVPVNSPHGPCALKDGRLLYAGKEIFTDEERAGVCESRDDGLTWNWIAELPIRAGDDPKLYHEFHLVEAADASLVLQVRNHNVANHHETLQTESTDGGKTWSPLHAIGAWGLPSHLLLLENGHLLMTYGYRRAPFGIQARISNDHGHTWSEAMTISSDGADEDLGYPSTAELGDDSLLTIWYERFTDSPRAVLRQARWKIV